MRLAIGALTVGDGCLGTFRTAEIVLNYIYVVGWGVVSWGHPWRLLMPLWSGRFVDSFLLRRLSDIRPCYLRNDMRFGRRGGFWSFDRLGIGDAGGKLLGAVVHCG